MNPLKSPVMIFCLILAGSVFLPAAHADEWNQMTKLSFNQPIEIPRMVLPAGSYWFVLLNDPTERDFVQIYSADWSRIYATLLTIPTYRTQSTADAEVEFAERPHQSPEVLLKWYYPGRLVGHEFIYLGEVASQLTPEAKQDVLARPVSVESVIQGHKTVTAGGSSPSGNDCPGEEADCDGGH